MSLSREVWETRSLGTSNLISNPWVCSQTSRRELAQNEKWAGLRSLLQPGRVIRLTARGTLFHPAQMSESLVGLATAAHGLVDVGAAEREPEPVLPPKAKQGQPRKSAIQNRPAENLLPLPEDALPAGDVIPVMGVKRELFAGLIKVIRGTFGEGLHLQLRPSGTDGPIVSSRLEMGRRFLDSTPGKFCSRDMAWSSKNGRWRPREWWAFRQGRRRRRRGEPSCDGQ